MNRLLTPLGLLAAAGAGIVAAGIVKRVVGSLTSRAKGSLRGFRGKVLHFIGDPQEGPEKSFEYFEDGLLVVENGKVLCCGDARIVLGKYKGLPVKDCSRYLLLPGFIDTHIHFPQIDMIGAYGEQLLEWLQQYTFPAEQRYADAGYAAKVAEVFLDELLRSGTTTALIFCTVHKQSAEALFSAAERRNMLVIAGKVMMDRAPFAPDELRQEAKTCYKDTKDLIDKWHGRGRNLYAVTPRFAITATTEQLELCAKLLKEYESKGIYMHTHMNENKDEVKLACELHNASSYWDVYKDAGLAGPRSIFAHCVQMTDADFDGMVKTKSVCAFCPTSNLFLGSGLFNIKKAWDCKLRFGLGTDVGAGTSFCQLQTLNEAYKVAQLQGVKLDAFNALYIATLGSAKALSLEHRIGNFQKGKEADFLCLDLEATPLQKHRQEKCQSLAEQLFVMMTLGDDRAVAATYVHGELVHSTPGYK